MAATHAYVMLEGISVKEGDWFDKKTGQPQVKYNLRCTGKSGATVWFNLFADVGQENTILKGFGAGQGVKITFLQAGDKGQFKNVLGISHADVKIEGRASGKSGADQDKIMMQACLKAAGASVPPELGATGTVSQFIWDVAEELFLKLNSRRFGGTTARPATAEMSKEEGQKYLEDPPKDGPDDSPAPTTPPAKTEEPDQEIPF